MKTVTKVLTLIAVSVGILSGTQNAAAQVNVNVSFQTFYDELSPYGYWMNTPEYGYVWQPNVASDFQPYATNGYWVMTEYGNTWVSEYDWGWAPFHYGRWYYDNYYGWLWRPDTEWGPAWVSWRSGNDCYGWAPMGPSIHVNIPLTSWIFVPHRHFTNRRFYNYCVPRTRVVHVYHQTTVINNYYTYNNRRYASGPAVREIERHTRSRVQVHQVRHEDRPGRAVVTNRAVRVYRPNVSEQKNNAPVRVNNAPRRSITRNENRVESTPAFRDRRGNERNLERNVQSQEQRDFPGSHNRSSERIAPVRIDRNRTEPNRPESPSTFPATRDNSRVLRRSETRPQENRNHSSGTSNENRSPALENTTRPAGRSKGAETEDRRVSPREQRTFQQESAQPQRRQERVERPQFEQPQPRQRDERAAGQPQRRTEQSQPSSRQEQSQQRPQRQSAQELPGRSHRMPR